MSTIGERIKIIRHGQKLSQSALAKAANVSQPTVANWENGSHAPRLAVLNRLAVIMNSSAHYLQNGGIDENEVTPTLSQYLQMPIRHIPIKTWPIPEDIENNALLPSPAHDYISVSTMGHTPFALIANDPGMAAYFPIGATIVFDAKSGPLEDGACYLFLRGEHIVLRRWQSAPERLEALPNQSAIDADFTQTRPTPLARALLSIRRH